MPRRSKKSRQVARQAETGRSTTYTVAQVTGSAPETETGAVPAARPVPAALAPSREAHIRARELADVDHDRARTWLGRELSRLGLRETDWSPVYADRVDLYAVEAEDAQAAFAAHLALVGGVDPLTLPPYLRGPYLAQHLAPAEIGPWVLRHQALAASLAAATALHRDVKRARSVQRSGAYRSDHTRSRMVDGARAQPGQGKVLPSAERARWAAHLAADTREHDARREAADALASVSPRTRRTRTIVRTIVRDDDE